MKLPKMDVNTFLILCVIGVAAGILSGFVGVGGGIIIVPALVIILGYPQMLAQGTSVFLMLPPIGIAAVFNYHKSGNINFTVGIVIACAFVFGAYLGSKWALKINPAIVKLIFGCFLIFIAIKLSFDGYSQYRKDVKTAKNDK
jgi:uncharacterized protein